MGRLACQTDRPDRSRHIPESTVSRSCRLRSQPFGDFVEGCQLKLRTQLAFPDHQHAPACIGQCFRRPRIADDIRAELERPEILIGFWSRGVAAARVSVPETAMNKDHRLSARESDIWSAGQTFVMQPEAQALSMQPAPKRHFGLRVSSPDTRHHPAADFWRDYIAQGASSRKACNVNAWLHPQSLARQKLSFPVLTLIQY